MVRNHLKASLLRPLVALIGFVGLLVLGGWMMSTLGSRRFWKWQTILKSLWAGRAI
jgi:hypothetical protein